MPSYTNAITQGAVAPDYVEVEVTSSTHDLSTATAAACAATQQTGATRPWSLTIESQSATTLVVRHELASGDAEEAGTYSLAITLTLPAGPVVVPRVALVVNAR